MNIASALWRPHDAHAHSHRASSLVLHGLSFIVFAGFALSWPGAVLLSILYIIAGYAAVIAGVSLHTIVFKKQSTWLLQSLGLSAICIGAALMASAHGALAILPVVIAAWLVTRARDGWSLTPSTVLLAFSLLLLSGFGDHPARTLALMGVHALTTGMLLLGLSPRPARAPMHPLRLVPPAS